MDIFLRRATYFLVFLLAASPLIVSETYQPFVIGKALWFRSILWILTPIFLIQILRNKNYLPDKNIGFLIFGVFILFQIFSAAFGYDIINSFWGGMIRMSGAMQAIHFFIFSLILFSIFRTFKEWIIIFQLISYIGFIITLLGILEGLNLFSSNFLNLPFWVKTLDQPFRGISSTLGNPVYLSWYLMLNLILSLAILSLNFKREKSLKINLINKTNLIFYLNVIFSSACILINFSRSTILSIGIASFILFVYISFKSKNFYAKAISLIIVLIILFSPSVLLISQKIDNDSISLKSQIITERIPDVKNYNLKKFNGNIPINHNIGNGGKKYLSLIGLNYDDYNNLDLEKAILNNNYIDDKCSRDFLIQKWIMGIEGGFKECVQLSKLLNKIPGNLNHAITQGIHSGDRNIAIKVSWNSWLNNPITGTGPQNFNIDYLKNLTFDDYIKSKVFLDDPHNSILKLLNEIGLIGLTLGIIFYLYIFTISIKNIKNKNNQIFWILISFLLICYFFNSLLQYSSFSNQLVMSFLIAFILRSKDGFSEKDAEIDNSIFKNTFILFVISILILTTTFYYSTMIYLSSSRMVGGSFTIEEYQKNVNIFPALSSEPRTEMIEIINNKFTEFIVDLDNVSKIVDQEYEKSLIFHPNHYQSLYQFGLFYYELSKYEPKYVERLEEINHKLKILSPDIQPTLDLKIREAIIKNDIEEFKKLYFEWKDKLRIDSRELTIEKGRWEKYDSGENFYDEYYESIK
tara:strand:- start:95 stop:2335 length:2241 start_codon:yes stop_codon:yes gene_type:complete